LYSKEAPPRRTAKTGVFERGSAAGWGGAKAVGLKCSIIKKINKYFSKKEYSLSHFSLDQ
jgi:hypothetical protein